MNRVLHGISASPGIVVGPVRLLRWEVPEVPHRIIDDDQIDAELARFRAAVDRATDRLKQVRERAEQHAGSDEAGIFEVQIGMLAERHAAGMTGRALIADPGDNTRGSHMLWIVRLDQGKTVADLLHAAESGELLPPWATHRGGPGIALPPRSTNASLLLEPGNYAMVCYIGSAHEDRKRYHFMNGMFRALTVVPSSAPIAPLPRADVVARIVDGGVVEFSTPLRVGRHDDNRLRGRGGGRLPLDDGAAAAAEPCHEDQCADREPHRRYLDLSVLPSTRSRSIA